MLVVTTLVVNCRCSEAENDRSHYYEHRTQGEVGWFAGVSVERKSSQRIAKSVAKPPDLAIQRERVGLVCESLQVGNL